MDRKTEKMLGAKIKRYSQKNEGPNGMQSEEAKKLVADFMLYSLGNPIASISDIPKKFQAIAEA